MHAREDLALALDVAPHTPTALVDERGCLHGWSSVFADVHGLKGHEIRGKPISYFWPELDAERWAALWRRIQQGESALVVHVEEHGAAKGDTVELEIDRFVCDGSSFAKVELRRSAAWRLHLMQQDILEAMASGAPLKSIMDRLCLKVEEMAPSVVCSVLQVDRHQRMFHVASPSLPAHYAHLVDGVTAGPKVGSCGTAIYLGEAVEVTEIATDPLWEDYRHLVLPLGMRACWSSPIKGSDGRVLGAFAFYYLRPRGPTRLERQIVATCLHLCMIALEHEETRARAFELSFTDPLTRLANRNRFQERLGECLAMACDSRQRVAVHYIGLDGFRAINETLGYEAGDELLKSVANRLVNIAKTHETATRIGGGEFALIQTGNLKDEDIANRARKIVDVLGAPYSAANRQLHLGTSIGIAIGPDDANSAHDLIHDAALAMRRVKELGRGSYIFYEKDLNDRMQRQRLVESDLRGALALRQFELHFQPIYNLQTGAIEAGEALLRWRHPEWGTIRPSEFIPIAEQSGLIEEIGTWVIREACMAASKWPVSVSIAINLSPRQFDNPDLAKIIASALAMSGLEPPRLELEVTESVLLNDSPVNAALLSALSGMGIAIALDDFGTGYSSLSYLHRFKFNRVKMDHSFVRDIVRDQGSLKIVRAIVMLAHSLGLEVTAEGVETDEQLAAVRGEGCDAVQGYYTGAPMPLAAFIACLGRDGGDQARLPDLAEKARTVSI